MKQAEFLQALADLKVTADTIIAKLKAAPAPVPPIPPGDTTPEMDAALAALAQSIADANALVPETVIVTP